MPVRMYKHFGKGGKINIENVSPVYNSFDKPPCKDNTNHIKALMMVQKDVIQEVLSDREKLIVNYCVYKEYRQNVVAKMLGVNSSTISRELKRGLFKLRKIIKLCDKAITHYERGSEE